MKDGMENIDEKIREAFDSFELDVDSSVWNFVQSSLGNGVGTSSSSSIFNTVVSKGLFLKTAATLLLGGTLVVAVVLLNQDENLEDKTIKEQVIVLDNSDTTRIDNLQEEKLTNVVNEVPNKERDTFENPKVYSSDDEIGKVAVHKENQELRDNYQSVSKAEVDVSNVEELEGEKGLFEEDKEEITPKFIEEKLPELNVSIVASTLSGKAPLQVEFNVEEEGIVNYLWDFGDGSTSNQKNTFHTFYEAGVYSVKLVVLDKFNRDKTVIQKVEVQQEISSSLGIIPNVFTPNGDGKNDNIKITGENLAKIEAFILDREGNIINTIKSLETVWDGRDRQGNMVNNGIYYISGLVVGKDGKEHTIKQAISVLK